MNYFPDNDLVSPVLEVYRTVNDTCLTMSLVCRHGIHELLKCGILSGPINIDSELRVQVIPCLRQLLYWLVEFGSLGVLHDGCNVRTNVFAVFGIVFGIFLRL